MKCKCLKCNYEWVSKLATAPVCCPKCKSYRWDRPKSEPIVHQLVKEKEVC